MTDRPLITYRIHYVHGALDGESDTLDITAHDMRSIHNDTALEFLRSVTRDNGETDEATVRIVPVNNVVGIEPLATTVMEPMAGIAQGAPLQPIAEPARVFTPADVAAGVTALGTPPLGPSPDWGT